MKIMADLKIARVVCVPVIFGAATFGLYSLAKLSPKLSGDSCPPHNEELTFPRSLEELKRVASTLQCYYEINFGYVLVLFCCAYIYKQSFAIPGSVFLNILAGALFGLCMGFTLVCILTMLGASCCYLLSKYCGRHCVLHFFRDKVLFLQSKVDENRHRLIYFLLFLRLFPMTPNWFLNMASPIINIPLHLFALSIFIGLMPYNYLCVQTGVVLSEVRSMDDVLSTSVFVTLLMMAAVALLPGILVKNVVNQTDQIHLNKKD